MNVPLGTTAKRKYNYLDELRNDLMSLDRHSQLYKLLKTELSKLGYWRNRERGNPKKGGQVRQSMMRINEE